MDFNVGVVGLGNMGGALATRLSNRFNVIGYDIDVEKRNLMTDKGVHCVSTLEEFATLANVVILSLPKAQYSLDVLHSLSPLLGQGTTIIETSTVLPDEVIQLSRICEPYGVKLVDAAILGGVSQALTGSVTLLVGNSHDALKDIEEILMELSSDLRVMGALGSGMAAKIINNAVAHSVMVLIVEAGALGMKLGISTESIYELLQGNTAFSRPLHHRFHERIMNGDYNGGMSTSNARKDSTLALNLAQQSGVPLFSIQSTHTVYEIAVQEGLGNLDYASIAKLWENWTDIDFKVSAINQTENK